MSEKLSIAAAAERAKREDAAMRRKTRKTGTEGIQFGASDSFVNFQQKLGIGADNALTSGSYGFNPISRIRTLLEWIHRGSWVGGLAIDVVADDMTRAGVSHHGGLHPNAIETLEETAATFGVWQSASANSINDLVKWARLYGGALAVIMVDGQAAETELRLDAVGKNQFKGLLVLDRWMAEPSLSDLVTESGPNLGMPRFYNVTADAPALPRMKIHHSRVIRMEGIRLPYYQRLMENLWGISVLERLYDRMIAFDSATTGAAQLVYKSYLRTLAVDKLRDLIGSNEKAQNNLAKYVAMMARFQAIEGVTLIDAADRFEAHTHSAFAGLAEALVQFGQQLSGALQIPLVRLFGQSPAGLNSSGESDLRTYYDNIAQRQNADLRTGITTIYRLIARSEGIVLPQGYRIKFKPLWQLQEKEKADIASTNTSTILEALEAGIIDRATALKELRQQSDISGVFTNISDDAIKAAEEEPPPAPGGELDEPPGPTDELSGKPAGTPPPKPNGKTEAVQ